MFETDAGRLAEALGLPLYRCDYFLPDYPLGECGKWRITKLGTGIDHGYYTARWVTTGVPVLLRHNPASPKEWETWMSLSPHEIESQEPGCLCVHGHTVIMGLGMGWVAVNAALNPQVTRVTVVELDRNVIDLFHACGISAQLPPEVAAKITIIQADALEWQPSGPVDVLYADIWRPVADTAALGDTQRMQANVKAREVYFWGQELRLYLAAQERFGAQAALTSARLAVCAAEDLQLPLLLPWGEYYGSRIDAAVKNRRKRGLPLEERA